MSPLGWGLYVPDKADVPDEADVPDVPDVAFRAGARSSGPLACSVALGPLAPLRSGPACGLLSGRTFAEGDRQMDVVAAVATAPNKPLSIETVKLEGPKEGEVLVQI